MRALIVVVIGALAGGSGSVAEAQPAAFGLAWQAPASCPTEAIVRARIAQRLGESLDDSLVSGIDIAIAREHGTFVARIDLRALTVANDVRTLRSRHCDELADAVAVVVARVARERAVGGWRVHAHGKRPDRIHTAPPPVVAVSDVDVVLDRHVEARRPDASVAPRLWSFGVRLSGVSGIGIVPEVGVGAELALTVRRRSALAELAGTRWLASGADARIGGPAHVDVGLQVTAARIGWRPEHLPLRAFAAAEVGTMDGVGVGVSNPQNNGGRWFAAGAGFGVAWQMTPWLRLVGSTEVLAAIERVRFALGNGVIVYAPSPMSARASCGIEVGWQ
jgi:hypothetical protein